MSSIAGHFITDPIFIEARKPAKVYMSWNGFMKALTGSQHRWNFLGFLKLEL
jgi:hypothetical protein